MNLLLAHGANPSLDNLSGVSAIDLVEKPEMKTEIVEKFNRYETENKAIKEKPPSVLGHCFKTGLFFRKLKKRSSYHAGLISGARLLHKEHLHLELTTNPKMEHPYHGSSIRKFEYHHVRKNHHRFQYPKRISINWNWILTCWDVSVYLVQSNSWCHCWWYIEIVSNFPAIVAE